MAQHRTRGLMVLEGPDRATCTLIAHAVNVVGTVLFVLPAVVGRLLLSGQRALRFRIGLADLAVRRYGSVYCMGWKPGHSSRLLILGWHNVEGTWAFPAAPGAGRRGLQSQLKILSRFANVVPLTWALERLHEGNRLPRRAVALTFDDGYADVLTHALPMLDLYGLPATFFLVPDFLSGGSRPWWEDLACAVATTTTSLLEWEGTRYTVTDEASRAATYSRLATRVQFRPAASRRQGMRELVDMLEPSKQPSDLLMNWDGARRLLQRGFDVQSHTNTHPVLSEESAEDQGRELHTARIELERELGITVTTIAYPHGTPAHYNATTIEAARAGGYRWGVTTREGFSKQGTPDLELRRCVMYPERGVTDIVAQFRYLVLDG